MKRLLCLVVFIALCFPVCAEELGGKACLQQGKSQFENKDYDGAISNLARAEKEFPLLGDYALLWLSDAYHESGNHGESLKVVRRILEEYPNSPLTKRARSREIRETGEVSGKDLQGLFESYLKEYPSDDEIRYLFAQWLKNNCGKERATAAFKDIYVEAGPLSVTAFKELSPEDVTVEDMIERASNLIKLMEYKAAESLLRSALGRDEGRLRAKILRELGLSLFRQKRYREAADVYCEAKDRYWEVRSLYRAGDREAVESAREGLLKSGERRFSSILLAVAADKRREGKTEEALEMYQDIMKRFPTEVEEALWGAGWTHYLAGGHEKAAEIFDKLCKTYNRPKYLYWKSRNLEAMGGRENVKEEPMPGGKVGDFYRIMLDARSRRVSETPVGNMPQNSLGKAAALRERSPIYRQNDRVEALLDLGFRKEAVSELKHISRKTDSLDDILYVCSKSQELGEYKLSVRSAAKVPYSDELHDFLYPRAFWDIVQEVSAKYSIDPLLVLSIVREESRYDSGARSPAGAIGLMQVMPRTALKLENTLKLGIDAPCDLVDAKKNLHVGSYYLSRLIEEFGLYPYAIAAYNAGEEVVRKWIRKGGYKSTDEFIEDIPYNETRSYVKRVITAFFEYKSASPEGENSGKIPFGKL